MARVFQDQGDAFGETVLGGIEVVLFEFVLVYAINVFVFGW
jgi:hypothetical protein